MIDNERRADRAAVGLREYDVEASMEARVDADKDQVAEVVGDYLGDVRHLCDRFGLDFADCDRRGHTHYVEELADEGTVVRR